MLALVDAPVVERPQLGALVLGVPLAEVVAVGVDALLGARLFLITPAATEGRGVAPLLDGVEQGADLQPVARGLAVVDDDAVGDRLLDGGDVQLDAQTVDPAVSRREHLGKVEAGIDLEQTEGDLGRGEGALGQPEHDDRVLAAGEHQDGTLELRSDLTDDVDRLGLEDVEVRQGSLWGGSGHEGTSLRTGPSEHNCLLWMTKLVFRCWMARLRHTERRGRPLVRVCPSPRLRLMTPWSALRQRMATHPVGTSGQGRQQCARRIFCALVSATLDAAPGDQTDRRHPFSATSCIEPRW